MIDTIKLVISFNERPEWIRKNNLQQSLVTNSGIFKATANPSSSYKKLGVYQPRLTYTERPSIKESSRTHELAIELSLPKLMFGNNFSELDNSCFNDIVIKLSNTLVKTYGIYLPPQLIEQADVRKIDYSKNIVFSDRTPVSNIVSNMRMADISRVYDVQNTNFKNGGHVYHIHTNSLDIAMYDKIADLKQEKISPKRSREKDGYVQMTLLEQLDIQNKVTVARFEVRINGLRKIRHELSALGIETGTTFSEMYNSNISRNLLLRHWANVFNRIPKALLDSDSAEHLLINTKQANDSMKLTETLARIGYAYLIKDHDERYIRNLVEGLFNQSQYRRFKQKSREPPDPTQLKKLMHITNILAAMKPLSISDFIP